MDTKPTINNFIIVILPALLAIFVIFFLVMPKVRENRVSNENVNKNQATNKVTNFDLEEFSETEFAALLNSLDVAASSQTISMSQEEALEIAGSASVCTMAGIPANTALYNENSKTWWIDLERMPELENDGCNPACVISEETKTAEVNWRCTGLISDNEQ